jgi:hypothetical protein
VTQAAQKTKVTLTLSPEAQKYARADAPLKVRKMAARGALPLEPIDLASVLFALAHDADAEVKSTARDSLDALPVGVLDSVLSGPANPVILSYFARLKRDDAPACEKIALNAATADSTIAFLASLPLRRVVDIISNNQERMMRHEEIVEALGSNPLTGRAVIERILTFLGVDAAAEDEPVGDEELTEEAAEEAVLALLGDEMKSVAKLLASEDDLEDESQQTNLFAAVQKMTVMQKIKLARCGGKEARSLLIKDRNKIVSTSVIQSPKLTETEVITIAQSRGVGEEILRMISVSKEWTRNYQVKHALATNPKCPQPQAIKFLNYLQDRDLKTVMKSKDVPSVISQHARRILTKKGKI